MNEQTNTANPLGTQPIGKLLARYAIPSVISMVVMALYNIVDQIFIGWGPGYLGNAATNVAFPVITIALALSLLVGNGSAAYTNLEMGRGNTKKAKQICGNSLTMVVIFGVGLTVLVLVFLRPLLRAMGATEDVMPYAIEYTSIIALGFPFSMFNTSAANNIRADGSPRFSMFSTLIGCCLNVILDPIFIFTFDMGVAGAAIATVISQIVSCAVSVIYFVRYTRNFKLDRAALRPNAKVVRKTCSYGAASFINQISIFAVNVVLNNCLTYYGQFSQYGSEIPLAAMGIVMKINGIMISAILGISIGAQPILGYNYGAGNYDRVKKTYKRVILVAMIVSTTFSILFVTMPELIVAVFGDDDPMFNMFAARGLSTYMSCVFAAGFTIPSSGYFQAVGKPIKSMVLTMTRQILILVPALLLLPLLWGLDGILYAMPVTDISALFIVGFFIFRELRQINEKSLPAGGSPAIPAGE